VTDNGDEEGPGEEGKENHQEEITLSAMGFL
jgi:hypothetical protein